MTHFSKLYKMYMYYFKNNPMLNITIVFHIYIYIYIYIYTFLIDKLV